MAFTEAQVKFRAKLSAKRIKTRQANGITLAYVEGRHVIAEANRILVTTPGTGGRAATIASGPEPRVTSIAPLIRPRCV